jgi:hypothetical protein
MKLAILMMLVTVPCFAILYNIDQPVPISLAHGEYYVGARLWGQGGALLRFGVGLFDRVTLGMSYGGNRFLGNDTIDLYKRPEFQARLAVLNEEGFLPAVALGFESQGYDALLPEVDSRTHDTTWQYAVRPRGGYLCVGKTITPIQTFVQVGGSYWAGFDGFVVANALLPGNVELILEYDPALNDMQGEWRGGLLNGGIGWTFAEKVRLVLALRDVIGNRPETKLNRTLELSINDHF